MAVGATTASERARTPVRTCIGCRRRAEAAELLRVVVACGEHGQQAGRSAGSSAGHPGLPLVVPDPRRRAPGRGAWLHPDPGCVALAERRRAFARALRVPGPVDPAPVREYVAGYSTTPTSGTPQELISDDTAMNRQQ